MHKAALWYIGVLTSKMNGLKLWFALLLSLIFCVESKGAASVAWQHVKTTGKEPYVAPVCGNKTEGIIVIVTCTIITERNRGSQCQLVYYHGKDFENSCDSRFRLMTENQTVSLHLSSLTPEDEVNVTCDCSRLDGTFLLHLNVTVEEEAISSSSSEELIPSVVIGVILFMVTSGAILGLICRNTCNRRQQEATTSHPDVEPGDIEPYSTFTQRESGLYSVVKLPRLNPRVFAGDDTNSGTIL
ncbi:uncharacterized protein LOC118103164 [Hippoglossus stenolepis]|uniref:uncharacterized protein LOC118103164 n=1 Tax=Hippoglossus stenolepis TaxID=195615 RepID=UPI001FAFAEE4|nr:uncharacterized protein LOC118103164 [Hippoglossus stenolepis]